MRILIEILLSLYINLRKVNIFTFLSPSISEHRVGLHLFRSLIFFHQHCKGFKVQILYILLYLYLSNSFLRAIVNGIVSDFDIYKFVARIYRYTDLCYLVFRVLMNELVLGVFVDPLGFSI